jgi:hypothetical protein
MLTALLIFAALAVIVAAVLLFVVTIGMMRLAAQADARGAELLAAQCAAALTETTKSEDNKV